MDNPKRTFAKALTWQALGFVMMLLLGYLATGSFGAAGGLAIAASLTGVVTYVLHERVWNRIRWGRLE